MVLVWYPYAIATLIVLVWCGIDMVLLWYWHGIGIVLDWYWRCVGGSKGVEAAWLVWYW